MKKYILNPIGKIVNSNNETIIELDKKYILALTGLNGFSHLQILWWFDDCDNEDSRLKLIENKPYKNSPNVIGTFGTRSPERPNPIALTCAHILFIDYEKGIIGLDYVDANDKSPVLDIKPYTPALDRVKTADVPDWCKHWPSCREESANFDWQNEFNF